MQTDLSLLYTIRRRSYFGCLFMFLLAVNAGLVVCASSWLRSFQGAAMAMVRIDYDVYCLLYDDTYLFIYCTLLASYLLL